MKVQRNPITLLAAVTFASMMLSGCYTQLALHDDESETVVESPATEPTMPAIVVIQPAIGQPWFSPPAVTVNGPPPPAASETRDIGNERPGSGRSESAGSGSRAVGASRGRRP